MRGASLHPWLSAAVKDVLELLAHGASWDEILEDYPFLEREDIQACLDFAAAQSDHALIKLS